MNNRMLQMRIYISQNMESWLLLISLVSEFKYDDCYIFSQGYSLYFFLILAHLWWFGVLGFGVGVLFWVFGVGVFSWWGLGPLVWGLMGFLGWGSLYKHKRITLGKKMVHDDYCGSSTCMIVHSCTCICNMFGMMLLISAYDNLYLIAYISSLFEAQKAMYDTRKWESILCVT